MEDGCNVAAHGKRGQKRTVIIAGTVGFCVGVRRAVDMAARAGSTVTGRYTTLGPLVHNEQVTARLEQGGVASAATLDEVREGTVVLSAHGSAPAVARDARSRGLAVLDATCPFVTRLHRAALALIAKGYEVVIVGDQGHTEMKALLGAIDEAGGVAHLVSSREQADALRLGKRVGVVSQTTQRGTTFADVVASICLRTPDVQAMNTVCGATEDLQAAALDLAAKVDVVLVVGGRKSANTRRLRELCEEAGTPAYQLETAAELDDRWLDGSHVVGITAGASTPDWTIREVASAVSGCELPEDWRAGMATGRANELRP